MTGALFSNTGSDTYRMELGALCMDTISSSIGLCLRVLRNFGIGASKHTAEIGIACNRCTVGSTKARDVGRSCRICICISTTSVILVEFGFWIHSCRRLDESRDKVPR